MKKRKKILLISSIVSAFLCIAAVIILYIFDIGSISQFSLANFTSKYEYDDAGKIKVEHETKTANKQALEEEREVPVGYYEKYVFVGDSRYRGMEFLASENDVFIAENGRGYDFLYEQMSNIKYQCDENTALIIGLGVNDKGYNTEKYIEILKDMADTMDCQIYYMLVNPVDEDKEAYSGYNVKNDTIDTFNETMKSELDDRIGIIDTNSYLKEIGFDTMDGLHYTNETYSDIYDYIKTVITE